MRVLHVSPSYYPAHMFGGPIQSVHLLNKFLVKESVQVDVITTNAGLESHYGGTGKEWRKVDGVRVKYFNYFGYIHYNFSLSLLFALWKSVKQYDIVHITAVWNFPVAAAAFICHYFKVPYIISPRGTLYPETIALKSTTLKRIYYRLISKWNLTDAAAIHYTTTDEAARTSQHLHLNTQALIIPNGLDLTEFKNLEALPPFGSHFNEVSNSRYILFLSRIDKKKGLDMLIPAFAHYAASFPDVLLVIAGPDNSGYLLVVKRMIEDYNLESSVIFTGMLSGDTKLASLRDAMFYILPSYSENFGMSVVEAMLCHTPVIISKQVALADQIVANEAGIVVDLDEKSIREAMITMTKSEHLREKYSVAGYQLAISEYDANMVAEKFKQSYQEIIDARI